MKEEMAGSASLGFGGFMAAFAVSGSVVLIVRQVHKRLLSDFMKQMEFELRGTGGKRCEAKKRVRFAEDVVEPSSNNKEYRKRFLRVQKVDDECRPLNMDDMMIHSEVVKLLEAMPLNRQNLYKGIIEYKTLKGYNV
ncbi:hypothetical protein Tsubulata_009899 [Turnera subulata]|uniref:Uncharacterized protein n=1 Tax=Turnera subulata TaxID=218843 RepID=A0A9Q0G0F4_9ROSI|nr:hypothetical protein Tsubulata_009899 [Turnera subulata]